ncbi:hypothetical protein, partial [Escherichia coli]|uniref:hypothetical protein n=1 Tax=Escherichia coli TaxID=562 RepID=UPI002078D6E3
CPSISDGRLSYQFSSDGYIRRSVYAYDNIEQKIDNIDHEIADLQAKRTRLVQQHPRIDE